MKKLLGILTCALLLCALCALAGAEEAEPFTSGNYQYILLEDGTAEITSISDGEEVIVPDILDGHAVTRIGNGAFRRGRAQRMVLPSGVVSIGAEAFFNSSIQEIVLPEGLKSIGDFAFRSCGNLKSFTIPSGVAELGENPFDGLQNLIVAPDHPALVMEEGVLFSKDGLRLICCSVGKEETAYAIPQGTETVDARAFYNCDNLVSVTIPDSVTYIGHSAFFDCSALTSVILPDSITSENPAAFGSCEQLTITVKEGGPAEAYCVEKNYPYTYADAQD